MRDFAWCGAEGCTDVGMQERCGHGGVPQQDVIGAGCLHHFKEM